MILDKISSFYNNYPVQKIFEKKTFPITPQAGNNRFVQADFIIKEIRPEGITLNNPGTYIFANDINWLSQSAISAIRIESSSVTLDFNNFSLINVNPNNLLTTAITATNSQNITIKNGKIVNMGLRGIEFESCKNIFVDSITVNGLTADNITEYIVPTGVYLKRCESGNVQKTTIQNVRVKTDSLAGIQITETINSTIVDCKLENFINFDGACTGIGHLACDGSIVQNCLVTNFQSFFSGNIKTQGHTCIGYVPFFSTNLSFLNCKATNIIGCCYDAHGFSIFLCIGNIQVRGCCVNEVQDGIGTNVGAKATGIEVYASGVIVSGCCVSNISAINPQDKQCSGFSCAFADNVKFISCKATNINVYDENGKQNSCLGYGTGFGWAPDVRPEFIFPSVNITYENCIAKKCQVGFDTWYHINSSWKNICSCCCGISVLNLLNSQRTLSCTPCSECNPPIIATLTNVANNNKFAGVKSKYC